MRNDALIAGIMATLLSAPAAYAQNPDAAPAAAPATPPAAGAAQAANASDSCKPMLSIMTNYNISADTYKGVKTEFDGRMVRLDQFIEAQKIAHFRVESLTFNVRRDTAFSPVRMTQDGRMVKTESNSPYRLTGSAEFQVDSSDNAFKIGQFLTQEKFEVTVSNKAQGPGAQCPQHGGAAGAVRNAAPVRPGAPINGMMPPNQDPFILNLNKQQQNK